VMMIDNEVQRKMTPKKVAELFSNSSKARENAK
jgi:NADH:ubiquinone oxidoreductase subunit E